MSESSGFTVEGLSMGCFYKKTEGHCVTPQLGERVQTVLPFSGKMRRDADGIVVMGHLQLTGPSFCTWEQL